MLGTLAVLSSLSLAQIDPASGIDFVTVGAVGNAPWQGNGNDPNDRATGRGRVNYEYRIGKYEVTTAQWAEFMNAAFDRPIEDFIPHMEQPGIWGAVATVPNTPGAQRWRVPAGNEMRAVGNISWRMAAIYCNWLHNDKGTNREAFLNGAYDVSTFGLTPGGRFTDQLTRSPGARYYVPSWDEWLKAAHYDPDKANSDGTIGGWWLYSNGSDSAFVPGPPGIGNSNFGFSTGFPGWDARTILLGSYGVESPWGLLDVSGFTSEWTEEPTFFSPNDTLPSSRVGDGSPWLLASQGTADMVGRRGFSESPIFVPFYAGFRVAAAIPSPSMCSLAVGLIMSSTIRRRRGENSAR
jgi:formylglycine-generating enzyme required for sulfatase activity